MQVFYCGVCGLPPEFTPWLPKETLARCKPWLLENCDFITKVSQRRAAWQPCRRLPALPRMGGTAECKDGVLSLPEGAALRVPAEGA